jgi:hypothetical protein
MIFVLSIAQSVRKKFDSRMPFGNFGGQIKSKKLHSGLCEFYYFGRNVVAFQKLGNALHGFYFFFSLIPLNSDPAFHCGHESSKANRLPTLNNNFKLLIAPSIVQAGS